MEVFKKKPLVILDGAHNPDGAKVLAKAVNQYLHSKRLTLVFGMLRDKDVNSVIREVQDLAHRIIVTKPNNDRAMEPWELAAFFDQDKNIVVTSGIPEAIEEAMKVCGDDDAIVFGGSLYMIGEARTLLRER